MSGSGSSRLNTPPAAAPASAPAAASGGVGTPVDPGELDYAKFTSTLTLAVEKASTIEELRDVADRTIEQIRSRKGEPAAHKARRLLYGG